MTRHTVSNGLHKRQIDRHAIPILKLSELDVSVGHRHLFHIEEAVLSGGEVWGLAGPNGRGKTTLLRQVAGLARPSKGNISLTSQNRIDVENTSPPVQPHFLVLYLASIPALLSDQTVDQNLEFYANTFGFVPTQADFNQVLLRTGLEGRNKQIVRSLSTGQKRRLTFSALDLIKPSVLIADEPTNGLDENGRELCAALFLEMKILQSIVLVATHDKTLLELCDKILDVSKLGASQNKARPVELL